MLITPQAPLRVRLTLLTFAFWARIRAAARAAAGAAPAARPLVSVLLELAAAAAAVHALFLIAPWLGWLAVSGAVGFTGYLLEPGRRSSSSGVAE